MFEYKKCSDKIFDNPIEIKYKNWKGVTSNRIIIPIKLWYGESDFHKGKQWFLRAYDIAKLDKRDFAIKDILEYIDHEEDWYKSFMKN
jgi:predicted DNA-binding transcriptional regulator YafY